MRNEDYVCVQCGPDPRGPEVHQVAMHLWATSEEYLEDGGDPQIADQVWPEVSDDFAARSRRLMRINAGALQRLADC